MLRVADLNHWKGAVNLSAMPIDAMITKATGGNGYVDDTCDPNVQQAIALNMPWGIYHYFGDGFNDNDPISEADWFINNCRGYLGKGQIWLDWERGGNPNISRVDMALAWLEHVRTTTGFKPAGIYMSTSIVTAYDWSPVINAGYALWDAEYPDNTTPIVNFAMDAGRDPNPHWDGVVNDVMWQFTSTGQVDGYSGNLDCNFFYGNRATWQAYINVPAPAAEPTPPVVLPPAQLPVEPTAPAETPAEPPTEPPAEPPVAPTPPVIVPVPVPIPVPAPAPSNWMIVAKRAFHTFWQAFVAVFAISITGLTSQLLAVHSFTDAKAFGLALVTALVAAVLSAVKSIIRTPRS